jgi:hypothetical protein
LNHGNIRAILLRDWDPLNVGSNPNLSDEYDAYIPELARLLEGNPTVDQIDDYLHGVETDDLGIKPPDSARKQTALALIYLAENGKNRET